MVQCKSTKNYSFQWIIINIKGESKLKTEILLEVLSTPVLTKIKKPIMPDISCQESLTGKMENYFFRFWNEKSSFHWINIVLFPDLYVKV